MPLDRIERIVESIDIYFKENNLEIIKKAEIRARFGFINSDSSAVWFALRAHGYKMSYNTIKRIIPSVQMDGSHAAELLPDSSALKPLAS